MLTHLEDDDDEQRILQADFEIARNVDDFSRRSFRSAFDQHCVAAPARVKNQV